VDRVAYEHTSEERGGALLAIDLTIPKNDSGDMCGATDDESPSEPRRQRLTAPERAFPLAGEDASWDLDDLQVKANLETPEDIRRWREYVSQFNPAGPTPDVVTAVWTAAQVAATTGALSGYVASAARKWRDKKLPLPEGTRLTLTLTPARKDDRRERAKIVISDIHTKTPDEITNEIRTALMTYAHGPRPGRGSKWASL
jgi:hypothetical protein